MPPIPEHVDAKFMQSPAPVGDKLLALRTLIFEVAAELPQTGGLVETLKWGEPSYLPKRRNVGTTIRIGPSKIKDFAIFVHCQTTLIDDFRHMFPDEFCYEGNRGVHFGVDDQIDRERLALLISNALTYHLKSDG